MDLAGLDEVPDLGEGDELGLEFFVVVPVGIVGFRAVLEEDEVGAVGEECGVGEAGADDFGVMAGEAGFFLEFAQGGVEGVFVGMDDTAWDFPGEGVCAEAVLLDEDEFVIGCDGEAEGPVGNFDDHEVAFFSVGVAAFA